MKKFFEDFRSFALKGNVMDMAVGVIIAAGFSAIVASFTENIINPIIGVLFQVDLSNVKVRLGGEVELGIGAFLSSIINFFLLAFVLFLIVRSVNKGMILLKKEDKAPAAAPAKSEELKTLEAILETLREQGSH